MSRKLDVVTLTGEEYDDLLARVEELEEAAVAAPPAPAQEPVVAEYWAVVDCNGKYIQVDQNTMQLEVYETEKHAKVNAKPRTKATLVYISATPPAPAQEPVIVPQGWKLVPVEPTPEMLMAADDGDDEYTRRNFGPDVARVRQSPYDHYVAMLAAAPPAFAQTERME